MKLIAVLFFVAFASVACLELTPNVSTDFSEIEARAVLEGEIRDICSDKRSRIPRLLATIDASSTEPTTDHWIFTVEGMELLVFESGVVAGDYIKMVKEQVCR